MTVPARIALVSFFLLFGCDVPPQGSVDVSVPTDTLVVRTVVGSLDSGGPDAFGQVMGVAADSAGRIFVADDQSHSIEVFDERGTHAFSIGREGQGPGELLSPCCIAWSASGDLWVRDRGNARYSVFAVSDSGATFVRSVRMPHGDARRPGPTTFRDSLVADIGLFTDDSGRRRVGRHWLTPSGREVGVDAFDAADPEELGGATVSRGDGAVTLFLYPPEGPTDLLDFGPGGQSVHGVSASYDLRLEGPDGDVRITRAIEEGPPLSDAEIRRARSRLEQLAGRIGGSVSDLPFGVPERKPPISDAYFAANGNLWVELSTLEGAPRTADVWSPDGELLRQVVWPGDVALSSRAWIDDDRAIGLRRDDLGVDYVVLLERAGSS